MRPPTTVFLPIIALIIIVAVIAAAPVVAETQNGTVPLEWDYSGDLLPGHKVTIRVHAVGVALPLFGGAFADAGVDVDGWRYGITGTDAVLPVRVYYFLSGRQVEIDKIYAGTKEYDAYITLYAYCPGERPQGAPYDLPDDTWMWVYVDFNGQQSEWFPARITAGTAPRIQLFYEQTAKVKSWANLQDDLVFKKCSGNVVGNPPDEGHDTRQDKPGRHDINIDKYIKWGFGLIAALGVLAVLPNFLRG